MPTPTQTNNPVATATPTPTPTPDTGGQVQRSFPNIPVGSNSGATGGLCNAELVDFTLTINCATDFLTSPEAHLDSAGLPSNVDQQYCSTTNVVNGDFQIVCTLTPQQRSYYITKETPNDIVPLVHVLSGQPDPSNSDGFGRISND